MVPALQGGGPQSQCASDTLYVVAATLSTNRKATSAHDALQDGSRQFTTDREIVLCVWGGCVHLGIQMADYALRVVQRAGRPRVQLVVHTSARSCRRSSARGARLPESSGRLSRSPDERSPWTLVIGAARVITGHNAVSCAHRSAPDPAQSDQLSARRRTVLFDDHRQRRRNSRDVL